MQELKRLLSIKNILVFVIIVIINVILFFNSQYKEESVLPKRACKDAYYGILDKCCDMSFKDATEYVNDEYELIKKSDDAMTKSALKKVGDKVKYLEGYTANVEKIIGNAKGMSAFSIFTGADNFSTLNIEKTIVDYERISGVKVSLENDLAIDAFFRYKGINILVFLFMIVMLYQMMGERSNGMAPIVRAAAGGRVKLAVTRQVIIIIMTLCCVITMYGITILCAFAEYGGVESLWSPIQNLESFSKYTFAHSQWQVLVIGCLKNTLVIYAMVC